MMCTDMYRSVSKSRSLWRGETSSTYLGIYFTKGVSTSDGRISYAMFNRVIARYLEKASATHRVFIPNGIDLEKVSVNQDGSDAEDGECDDDGFDDCDSLDRCSVGSSAESEAQDLIENHSDDDEHAADIQAGDIERARRGEFVIWCNGYCTLSRDPRYGDAKIRLLKRWTIESELTRFPKMSHTEQISNCDPGESEPCITYMVLRAWMVNRMKYTVVIISSVTPGFHFKNCIFFG